MWKALANAIKKVGLHLLKALRKKRNGKDQEDRQGGLVFGTLSVFLGAIPSILPMGILLGLGMLLLGIILFISMIFSMLSDFLAPSRELAETIDTLWAAYAEEYGDPSDAERLSVLIADDDAWETLSPYFAFDRETMAEILSCSQDSQYIRVADVQADVVLYAGSRELSLSAYKEEVPVYLDVGSHTLSWEMLYGILCGIRRETVTPEIVRQVAAALSPEEIDYETEALSLSELQAMDTVTDGPFPMDDTVFSADEAVIENTYEIGNVLYVGRRLSYEEVCPILDEDGEYRVWDGMLTIEDGSTTYTPDPGVAESAVFSYRYDERRAVQSLVSMPGGYLSAVMLSEVISDGSVDIVVDGTALSELLSPETLATMLSFFHLNTVPSGNLDATAYVERADRYGDRMVIYRQYGAGKDVYWWSQIQYDHAYYGAATIHAAGCGPSSLAIVYSSLTGEIMTPVDTASYCADHGYICYPRDPGRTCGTASIFDQGAVGLGLTVDFRGNGSRAIYDALPYLRNGDLLVCQVGRGNIGNPIYNGSGHYLVVRGVTPEGKLLLADPGTSHIDKNLTEFSVEDMAEILDRPAGNGNVWAFSYGGTYHASGIDWN